jgi:hypothetical protein
MLILRHLRGLRGWRGRGSRDEPVLTGHVLRRRPVTRGIFLRAPI